MKDATQFHIRPARPEEAGLFYTPHPEEDKRLGTIGHVRMDFGRSGNEFWHTWWPRGPEELNSPVFKLELQEVVDTLRESVLKNRFAMERFCYEHGGKISGGWTQNYGYIVETEHYRYCLRCNPSPGDYNGYLTAYDLAVQWQNMARDKPRGRQMSQFNFIYAEEHLSHREKAVYIYLRDRADASGVCWPGIKTIARELGLSPRTVQRALADLERRQLIEKRNRRRSNGSLTSNLYRLAKQKTSQPPAKGGL